MAAPRSNTQRPLATAASVASATSAAKRIKTSQFTLWLVLLCSSLTLPQLRAQDTAPSSPAETTNLTATSSATAPTNTEQAPPSTNTADQQALQELQDYPLWQQAQSELTDHLPELAAESLGQLRQQHYGQLSPNALTQLSILQLEALVRSKQYTRALRLSMPESNQIPTQALLESRLYWRAQALIGVQRWDNALDLLAILQEANSIHNPDNSPLLPWIQLAQAIALRGKQQHQQALESLQGLIQHPDPKIARSARLIAIETNLNQNQPEAAEALLTPIEQADDPLTLLLRCRLLRQNNQLELAANRLQPLLRTNESKAVADNTTGISQEHQALATLELSRIYLQQGRNQESQSLLTLYLDRHPLTSQAQAFAEVLYQSQWHTQDPPPPTLIKWQESAPSTLQRSASWLLAQHHLSQQQNDQALQLLEQLIDPELTQSYSRQAALQLAILAAEQGQELRLQQLIQLLATPHNSQDQALLSTCLEARSLHSQGKHQQALDLLQQSLQNHGQAESILQYNRAWIALHSQQQQQLHTILQQLQPDSSPPNPQGAPNTPSSAAQKQQHILFELFALSLQPGHSPAEVNQALENLLSSHPSQRDTALLAWLGWALQQPPEQQAQQQINHYLSQIERDQLTSNHSRRQYDEIQYWVALQQRRNQDAASALESYTARYPNDPRADQFRLRLAQQQYTDGDYAGALNNFDQYLRRNPDPTPDHHAATYGAARATLQLSQNSDLTNAVNRFQTILNNADSPYRYQALLGQVQANKRIGSRDSLRANILLLNQQLQQDWNTEHHPALRCQLAESQLALNNTNPALELWQQVLDNTQAPLYWRERSAYKLAQYHQSRQNTQTALRNYRRVILGLSDNTQSDPHYYIASARAAILLLENDDRWQAAIRIAEQAAAALSPEIGNEFSQYAEDQRLRHFINP